MTGNGKTHAPRRRRSRARRRVLQALYQWQLTGQDSAEIERQFLAEHNMTHVDLEYFAELLYAIPAQLASLDALIEPVLDRPLAVIDPIEKAILRMGAYELTQRLDIPYRVVVNEAVDLARLFGAEQSHRYINGVLDRVGHGNPLRAAEIRRRRAEEH
ncbi:MAG: transcription antitermination factor NusB [Nitrococcus mobilis]|nr:transcription antitermination factor NusB [Nitrococcus mobilis]